MRCLITGLHYYYNDDEKVKVRIGYDKDSDSYELVLFPYQDNGTPKDKYTIDLSYDGAEQPLTFTVNVEKEVEEPDTQPVVDSVKFESTTDTVTGGNAFEASYNFRVTTEDGRPLTYPFTKPFTFAIGDKVAEYQKVPDNYVIKDLGLTFRVVKGTEDNQFQLVVVGDSQKVTPDTYTIKLGIEGKEYAQDFSLIVDQPTPPSEPDQEEPEVQKITYTLTQAEQTQSKEVTLDKVGDIDERSFTIKPQFSPTLSYPYAFFEGLVVTINDKSANRVGESFKYKVEDSEIALAVEYDESLYGGQGGYRVTFDSVDQSGKYVATIQNGEDNPPATFTLNVTDPVTPPTPTDPEEEVKSPTVTEVSFPQGSTKTVSTEVGAMGVELPLNFTFSEEETKMVDFKDLGYSVSINGKDTVLNGSDYVLADSNIKVTFTNRGNGSWQAFLFKTGADGQRVALPADTYSIEVVSDTSKDFEFSIVLEEPTPTPTPPTPPTPEDKEEDVEQPPSGGNGGGSQEPDKPSTEPDPVDPTPPPTEPEDKEEEKEEPGTDTGGNNGGSTSGGTTGGGSSTGGNNGGSSTGGDNTGGGSSTGGTTGGNSGGSSTGGSTSGGTTGGTTTEPKPENPPSTGEGTVTPDQPTPVPPKPEVTNKPEALEKLPEQVQQKVDSLMTEVFVQDKGIVLDLVGDTDDLSSVSTLEITSDGVFIDVDGEKVKFNADLKLEEVDMSKLRITRVDGSPIPYKTNGESFTLSTSNFSDILITERVAIPFEDVKQDDWFAEYVDEAFNRGITTGTTATTFSPNDTITRGQLAALLARAYELKPTNNKSALKDIEGEWYADDVQALIDNGIIKGYEDGTFRGDQAITREQLAVMLHRLAEQKGMDTNISNTSNFTDTDKMSSYGKSAIEWAAEQGIINSGKDVAFRPKDATTRAQVAKMITLFIGK